MYRFSLLVSSIIFVSHPTNASPYLGTQKEHIHEGISKLLERELQKEKRKLAEANAKPAAHSQSSLASNKIKKQDPEEINAWDAEVLKLMKPAKMLKENRVGNSSMAFQAPLSPVKKSKRETRKALKKEYQWISEGFPNKAEINFKEETVKILPGSFIRATLLSGADAPIKASVPVLIKLANGFFGPNNSNVDLSGCFAIAKAMGDINSLRVTFQTQSISCTTESDGVFHSSMDSFAIDMNGSLGVPGELHSRQGRVATMAFLNGVVEGATKLVSLAPEEKTTNSFGQTVASQASSSAASQVVSWYLEHAKNLMPSVEVKGGQSLRLILLKPLEVPQRFLKSLNLPSYVSKEHIYETSLIF